MGKKERVGVWDRQTYSGRESNCFELGLQMFFVYVIPRVREMPANKPISVLFIVLMASLCRGLNQVEDRCPRSAHVHRSGAREDQRDGLQPNSRHQTLTKSYQGPARAWPFLMPAPRPFTTWRRRIAQPAGFSPPSSPSRAAPRRADRGQHPASAAPPAGRGDSPSWPSRPSPRACPAPPAAAAAAEIPSWTSCREWSTISAPGSRISARCLPCPGPWGTGGGPCSLPPAPPQHLPLLPLPLSPFAGGARLAAWRRRRRGRQREVQAAAGVPVRAGREHRGGRAGGGRGGGGPAGAQQAHPGGPPALTPPSPSATRWPQVAWCPAPPCPSRCSAPSQCDLRLGHPEDYKQSLSTL